MSSAPNMRGTPRLETFRPVTPQNPLPFYLDPGEGGPEGAQIICGFLGCDVRTFNPLIAALPRMMHVAGAPEADDGWLASLIAATLRESRSRRIGSGGVLTKLSELIFIEAVRRHAEAQPEEARSWLAGLADPLVGRALRALHADPSRPWTLATLAREAGASRTILRGALRLSTWACRRSPT